MPLMKCICYSFKITYNTSSQYRKQPVQACGHSLIILAQMSYRKCITFKMYTKFNTGKAETETLSWLKQLETSQSPRLWLKPNVYSTKIQCHQSNTWDVIAISNPKRNRGTSYAVIQRKTFKSSGMRIAGARMIQPSLRLKYIKQFNGYTKGNCVAHEETHILCVPTLWLEANAFMSPLPAALHADIRKKQVIVPQQQRTQIIHLCSLKHANAHDRARANW